MSRTAERWANGLFVAFYLTWWAFAVWMISQAGSLVVAAVVAVVAVAVILMASVATHCHNAQEDKNLQQG